MQRLIDTYPLIGKIGPWLGGFIGGYLLTLLKNRRALLTYNVAHQRIAMSADDEIHGKVVVTYRGNVVHNLFLSTVTVRNSSIRDLENLDLKACRAHDSMLLLTEQTAIDGTLEYVPLTQEYIDRIEQDSEFEKQVLEAETADQPENKQRLDSDARFRHGRG